MHWMGHRAVHRFFVAACLLCILPVVEPQVVGNRSRVAIELGSVTVWLGMPQTDVLLQFQSAGYKLLGDNSTARRDFQDGNHVYSVWFKNGKVACADREWYSTGGDEMGAVLGALAAIASHGASSCSIIHDPINEPGNSADRILIQCGQRSVVLVKGKIEPPAQVLYVSAFERIGQIP